MAVLKDKLSYLVTTKRLIKEAIQTITYMPDDTVFRDYPKYILSGYRNMFYLKMTNNFIPFIPAPRYDMICLLNNFSNTINTDLIKKDLQLITSYISFNLTFQNSTDIALKIPDKVTMSLSLTISPSLTISSI